MMYSFRGADLWQFPRLLLGSLNFLFWDIELGHKRLVCDRRSHITAFLLAGWQVDRLGRQVFIGDQAEQVMNAVEPRTLFIISIDHIPGRLLDIGVGEHLIL